MSKYNKWWSKRILAISVLLPAGANFFANILVVRFFGIELFGSWLIWKTACQLTSNISPGFGLAMSVLLPEKGRCKRVQSMYYDCTLFSVKLWIIFSTILASVVIFFYYDFSVIIALGLILFWSGLCFSGFTGSAARGYKNGKIILYGGVCEAVGTIFAVIAAFMHNFELFIVSQGIKSWMKCVVQYQPSSSAIIVNRRIKMMVIKKTISVGIPLFIKGWVQTAYQYGDKLILGIFFGAGAAGVIGLGGLYAMPIIILSSSASAWLLPLLLSKSKNNEIVVFKQIFLSLLVSFFLSFFILFMPIVIPDSIGNLPTIFLAYVEVSILSVMTIHSTYIISNGNSWLAVIIDLFVVTMIFIVMYFGRYFSIDISIILLVSILFLNVFFLFIAHTLKTFSGIYWKIFLCFFSYSSFAILFFLFLEKKIFSNSAIYSFY